MRPRVHLVPALALAATAALAACGENLTPAPEPDAPGRFACVPTRDGVLTADELPVAIGASIDYYVSPAGTTRTVDLVGTGTAPDHRWDLATEYPDDARVASGSAALDGQWYASDFPGGQFVADAGGGNDGVYREDDTALWLLGLASHDPAPATGKTLLRYDAPVAVLRFPLADGDAWTETGHVTAGTLDGLPYVGTDTYEIDATGSGALDLPYVRFSPALRVRTHVTIAPAAGGATVSRRQTSFFFECAGEVARAESRTDEPDPDFTVAAALRRFAL